MDTSVSPQPINKTELPEGASRRAGTARNWVIVVLILLLSGIAGGALYYAYLGQQKIVQTRQAIAAKAVSALASQISSLQSGLRQSVRIFVSAKEQELVHLSKYPADSLSFEVLTQQLHASIPQVHAIALTDSHGVPLVEEKLGLVGGRCAADVRDYFSRQALPKMALHESADHYHFDVFVPIPGAPQNVLLVTFDAGLIVNLLRQGQLHNHHMYLVRADADKYQVEIAAEGDRGGLGRSYILSQQERAAIEADEDVPGTHWRLVAVAQTEVAVDLKRQLIIEFVAVLLILLITSGVIIWLLVRSSRQASKFQQQLQAANGKLQHLSLHDPLTGLPNRNLFHERLQQKVVESNRSGERFGLMLVSLDNLSELDEKLGIPVGDQLLREIGGRIRDLLRDVDTVTRLERGIFALLLHVDSRDQVEIIAAKILTALKEPYQSGESRVSITASVGMAFFPDHGRNQEQLFDHAETALKLAEDSPHRTMVYEPDEDPHSLDRLSLLTGIRDAMSQEQLYMVFQPKLALTASPKISVEALLRWRHPVYGELGPDDYLPLVEQTDTMIELTHWTIERTLETQKKLRDQGVVISAAINLSVRMLANDAFPLWLQRTLNKHGVPADDVRMEITESAVMDDSETARQILLQIAAIGVGLSVDDFGTGHSSLSYLSRLPVDELKIDKSFVDSMNESEADRAIVKATIDLAHDLGLQVVAEGVETLEQATALREMECDLLQGYYVSRPMTEEKLLSWAPSQVK